MPTPNEAVLQNAWDKNKATGLSQWQKSQIDQYATGHGERYTGAGVVPEILPPATIGIGLGMGDWLNQLMKQFPAPNPVLPVSAGTNILGGLLPDSFKNAFAGIGSVLQGGSWISSGLLMAGAIFIPKMLPRGMKTISRIIRCVLMALAIGNILKLNWAVSAIAGVAIAVVSPKVLPLLGMAGVVNPVLGAVGGFLPALFKGDRKRKTYRRRWFSFRRRSFYGRRRRYAY